MCSYTLLYCQKSKPMKKLLIALGLMLNFAVLKAQTCDRYIAGYIPSYRDPSTVDYTKLSYTFYAFGNANVAGEISVDAPDVFNTYKTSAAGTQKFLSITGGGNNLSNMAASSTAINAFASNCVTFCQDNSLQGIDIDWEGITTAGDSVKFGAVMRKLAAALHDNSLKLVITVAYGSYGGDFYNVGALKTADWIQLMVYDQTGTWADSPYGNHSTYQHMLDAITYWTNRGYTDVSKVVIGLPFYGYQFNSTAGGLATAKTYSEIIAAYPNLSCETDEKNLLVFNGPATIRSKVQYVIDNGLKGVMIWELGQDISSSNDKSLLNAVSKAACGDDAACVDVVSGLPNSESQEIIVENPVQSFIKVSVQNAGQKISRLELVDNLGRVTIRKENNFSEDTDELNVANHAAGIYMLRVTLQDQRTIVKRVVKR
jgi:chitinase